MLFLCLILFIISFSRSSSEYEIPFLKVSGSHYESLFTASRHFKDKIQNFVNNYSVLNDTLLPWYNKNRELYSKFVDLLKSEFPQYYNELRGISDGADIEFYKIMLLNTRMEIEALIFEHEKSHEYSHECTDIHVRNEEENIFLMGHNEDGSPSIYRNSFLVDFDIDGDIRFTTYCYPGIIPGNAFAWNKAGLIFGGNALTPKEVLAPGIPRMVLYRHSISATTIDESISNIQRIPNRAFGVSINLGNINNLKRQVNYEFSSSYFASMEIRTANYSHMNNFKYLNIPYFNSISTVHRQARVDEFQVPKNKDDVRKILGDTKDEKYPIYNSDTLATAIFDITGKTVDIYSTNPKLAEKPLYTMSLEYDKKI